MRKSILSIMSLFIVLVALMFILSGCNDSKLSGTYVNPNDNSKYVVLDEKTATFYEDVAEFRSVTFETSAKTSSGYYLLTITDEERYYLDEKKETIYTVVWEGASAKVGEIAFTKEN